MADELIYEEHDGVVIEELPTSKQEDGVGVEEASSGGYPVAGDREKQAMSPPKKKEEKKPAKPAKPPCWYCTGDADGACPFCGDYPDEGYPTEAKITQDGFVLPTRLQ